MPTTSIVSGNALAGRMLRAAVTMMSSLADSVSASGTVWANAGMAMAIAVMDAVKRNKRIIFSPLILGSR